jgi:PIN domain nuclease of toxin-antitoxin system
MILLLDTHAVLWFWWNDPHLSASAMAIICDSNNRKLVSPATAWEVAIKVSLKKLDIGGPYRGFFPLQMLRNNFEWLPISDDHLAGVVALPFHHKDPFDRMLAAQALAENISIVSADPVFNAYGVTRLW